MTTPGADRSHRRARIRIAVACLAATLLAACGAENRRPPGRVLLIGIDGASPRLTGPWMEKGLLPNLARIAKRGVYGKLRSHRPLLSPRIWTSIATGKTPSQHGIYSWVFSGDDGKPRLYRSSDRQTHALWNIASAAGMRVGVVNWLNTYPPEKVNGVMVSDFAIPGERKAKEGLGDLFARNATGENLVATDSGLATTHPAEWVERLEKIWASKEAPPRLTDTEESQQHLREGSTLLLTRSYESDRLVTTTAVEIDSEIKPQLLMVYLSGIDRSCHFLWGGFEAPIQYAEHVRFSPKEKRAAAQAVRRYYQYTDALIGELLAGFGENDLVLIVSDHGFEARVEGDYGLTGTHETEAAEHGVIFARGPGIEAGSTVGEVSVNDITPTILAWLGLPLGADMDGQPAAFVRTDAPTTIPTHDLGEIERIGGAGDAVEDSIIDELRALGYVDDEALPEKRPAQ